MRDKKCAFILRIKSDIPNRIQHEPRHVPCRDIITTRARDRKTYHPRSEIRGHGIQETQVLVKI